MQSTRDRIIETLSVHPRSTIVEIAEYVGINAISVRHHITNLQASSMVLSEEERHGIGRPRMVFSLSEKGMEHFPTSYLRLTNNLLSQLKQSISHEEINLLFQKMAERTASDYQLTLENLDIEKRLEILREVMQKEGFNIRIRSIEGEFIVDEISCPFYRVGKAHPEICIFDKTLIARILDIPLDKIQPQLINEAICSFKIKPE